MRQTLQGGVRRGRGRAPEAGRVLQKLLRRQAGPKSERLDPDQFQLALEAIEQDQATAATAAEEAAAGTPDESRRRRRKAPAPDSIIPGDLPTEGRLAAIAVAKYQDGNPLYRQCQIFARDGVRLDRQTLSDWMGRVAWWVFLLWERLVADVLASPKLFVDDTYLVVLDRTAKATSDGKTGTRTGYLWGLARDDAPWRGDRPPAALGEALLRLTPSAQA